MTLLKCDNCGQEYPEEEIDNHKLYCIFSIQQKELENLIPCEICDQLINFSDYNRHLLYCNPVSIFSNINFPPLNSNSEDNFEQQLSSETRNLLSFIDEIDNLLNRLNTSGNYDDLLILDENNVSVGVNNINKFITKKEEKIICPICTIECEKIGETKCGHKFCYECIEEWLKDNKKCPVCMIEFNEN